MPSTSKRRSNVTKNGKPFVHEREIQRKALRAQLRLERDVQKLTRQLQREMQKSHDRLQALGILLASRARAIEAEREASNALRG